MFTFRLHRLATVAIASLCAVTIAPAQATSAQGTARTSFTLTSADIKAGATIGAKHVLNAMGCTGQNSSPALSWSGAPAGTKSFALTVYDPDAPTGSGWWHWMVYNIPANISALPAGAGDAGKQLPGGAKNGPTDFGKPGWGGPCPPPGDKPHRYIFTLYALKTDALDIPVGATSAYLGFNISGNLLGKTSFTALYGR